MGQQTDKIQAKIQESGGLPTRQRHGLRIDAIIILIPPLILVLSPISHVGKQKFVVLSDV